jgi:hypothetical protein
MKSFAFIYGGEEVQLHVFLIWFCVQKITSRQFYFRGNSSRCGPWRRLDAEKKREVSSLHLESTLNYSATQAIV